MSLTSEQMILIFGTSSVVFLLKFLFGLIVQLPKFFSNSQDRRKVLETTKKDGMLLSMSLSVVLTVLLF